MTPPDTAPVTTFHISLEAMTVFVTHRFDMNAGGASIEDVAALYQFVRELFAKEMFGLVPSELLLMRDALGMLKAPGKETSALLGTVQLALSGDAQAIIACVNWAQGDHAVDKETP